MPVDGRLSFSSCEDFPQEGPQRQLSPQQQRFLPTEISPAIAQFDFSSGEHTPEPKRPAAITPTKNDRTRREAETITLSIPHSGRTGEPAHFLGFSTLPISLTGCRIDA